MKTLESMKVFIYFRAFEVWVDKVNAQIIKIAPSVIWLGLSDSKFP